MKEVAVKINFTKRYYFDKLVSASRNKKGLEM
jgi:hypothetical protein